MRRGTTPDYVLTVAGFDLTVCKVYVTLAQYVTKITLTDDRLEITYDDVEDTSSIVFNLTQAETLQLKSGNAEIQVRFIDSTGEAQATEIKAVPVLPVLFEGVIAYDQSSGNQP